MLSIPLELSYIYHHRLKLSNHLGGRIPLRCLLRALPLFRALACLKAVRVDSPAAANLALLLTLRGTVFLALSSVQLADRYHAEKICDICENTS